MNGIKKVVFFNYYHNGDLHLSRGLVNEISKICHFNGIDCEYYHKCDPSLLSDLQYIKYTNNNYGKHDRFPSSVVGDVLFINTWYAGNEQIFNSYGVSFDTLYRNFNESIKPLGIRLEDINQLDLFPSIKYECFDINNAKEWLNNNNHKRVFISNGKVLSGQSDNFPFVEIIDTIASNNEQIDFLISNHEDGIRPRHNVYMTSDIIKKNGVDLNENAFLAANCSLIVGRLSGTYSFAMNRDNYFDNPKTFLVITSMTKNECYWTHQFTPPIKAKIEICGSYNKGDVISAITNNLPKDFQS
jgi:hypothetical protein